jgi:hypothetical protein
MISDRGLLARLSRRHASFLGDHVDAWVADMNSPVIVHLPDGRPHLHRRFSLATRRLGKGEPGGAVGLYGNAYSIKVSMASGDSDDWMTDWVLPQITTPAVLSAVFPASDDQVARMVTHVMARAIADGEVPIQGRNINIGFHRAARVIALALAVRENPDHPDFGYRISPVESES